MKIMAFDLETTGLPIYKEPSEGANQPHIVELAALLYTGNAELIDTVHRIVKPDGWIIPDDVAAIHGITTERAMDEGIPEHNVVAEFHDMQQQADLRVAHNVSFDDRIMRIAFKRFGDGRATHALLTQEEKDAIADTFKSRQNFCTAKAATKPCNLPPTPAMVAKRMNFPKTPTLAEAYKHYFGEELVGAHSAMADTIACARLYFAIQATA